MRNLSDLRAWPILLCLLAAMPAAAVRIPGGPQGAKAIAADCYGGIEVVNVNGDAVSLNKHGVPTAGCMDGTACDHGAAYDDSCTFRIALCAAQRDVDGCTAPASLQSFRATGKVKGLKKSKGRLTFEAGPLAEGCGEFADLVVPVKKAKNGSRVAGSAILKLVAKAPRGVTPRTDKDTIVLSCEPIPPGTCVDSAKCDDGDACTADVCTNGVCSNPALDCSTPPDACSLAGACDAATGQCIYPPADDGTSCGECSTCVGGACQPNASGESCVGQDGVCNADGVCELQCQDEDTSACSSNKCETYTCDHGRCVLEGPVVCPLPPEIPDCYGPAFCNPETGSCNRTYLGDNAVCGDQTADTESFCCDGQCVPSNEDNCGACGNACVEEPVCVKGSCTCTANLLADDANCGTCGNACVNSICFQGQCLDGCVIDGHFHVDGEPDPANECQICKTSASRTSWTALHTDLGDLHFCNAGGCRQSQCYNGRCGCGNDPTCAVLVPENATGGCASTPCADAACVNDVCVYTAKNEDQGCDSAFDPRSRTITRAYGSPFNCVGRYGTCESGICNPGPAPDGGSCLVEDFADPEVCTEPYGTCHQGECTSPRHVCPPLPDYCPQRHPVCSPDSPIVTCVPGGAPPPSGTIECGTIFDPQPQKCCDGQRCVCPPTAGFSCIALECRSS